MSATGQRELTRAWIGEGRGDEVAGLTMRLPARLILEQVADAVIYADAAGIILLWNDAAAALFGYSAAVAVGQSLNSIIPEHLRSPGASDG